MNEKRMVEGSKRKRIKERKTENNEEKEEVKRMEEGKWRKEGTNEVKKKN